jgi:hypothetical protein
MRSSMILIRSTTACAFVTAVCFVGCDRADKSEHPASVDSRFILKSEPSGAVTPTQVMETQAGYGPITLVGRVDAGEFDPFEPGQASFMLSQLPDADHAGGDPDHADNCPFCKRKLEKAPKVVVKILESGGEVMPVDARELLGIAKGDTLVVRGNGQYSEAVNLVEITADGVFRK